MLFPVFVIFSFTSVVDLVIALQEDGILMGFMDFYTKEVGAGWLGMVLAPAHMLLSPTAAHRVSPTCAQHMASSSATGMVQYTTCSIWPWPVPSAKGEGDTEA